jgi:hypothetical protein
MRTTNNASTTPKHVESSVESSAVESFGGKNLLDPLKLTGLSLEGRNNYIRLRDGKKRLQDFFRSRASKVSSVGKESAAHQGFHAITQST